MPFTSIFKNNEAWVAEKLAVDPSYFERLAEGQNPQFLYIGCSDSRVTAEELMGVEPGKVFVHRNIANLVVGTDNNVNAVIQYAVEVLEVQHIIVCGHYGCGGVQSALQPQDMGQLNAWLQNIRDVYRHHQAELDGIADIHERTNRLVELNVLEQCLNVLKIDHVQKQWYKTGSPKVHGWVFNVRTGKLQDMKLDMVAEFERIRSIYHIQS